MLSLYMSNKKNVLLSNNNLLVLVICNNNFNVLNVKITSKVIKFFVVSRSFK